jgi:NADH-quinone oxidoreductase subunit H
MKSFFLVFGKLIAFLLIFVSFVLFILLAVAYYTLGERKIMASAQRRKGPNVAGFFGLLQPLADGLKLIFKEIIIPQKANKQLFILAPILTFALSLLLWGYLPFTLFLGYIDTPYSLIYLFAISSLSIFGIIGAGWASNSKYAILGSLRSAGQLISYEIAIGFSFLTVGLVSESLNILDILIKQTNQSNFVFLFPILIIFFISALAETNRAPFDLPEAEAEIVAGYNIEYSGVMFALFFLGEYSNMLIMSVVTVILFFGKYLLTSYGLLFFSLKVSLVAALFVIVRATLPRVRYDQLMFLGWNIFLPISLGFFYFILSIYYVVDLSCSWHDLYYAELFFNLFPY